MAIKTPNFLPSFLGCSSLLWRHVKRGNIEKERERERKNENEEEVTKI